MKAHRFVTHGNLTRALALAACACVTRSAAAAPAPASASSSDGQAQVKLLVRDGGRVAWYHGDKHDLIAYDAIVNARNRNTEVFVMNPDGSGKRCVTCDSSIPKGFIGQPDWYPDGEHLIVQAENSNSKHGLFNHMSWGIDDDLWLVKLDGTGAQRIFATEPGQAALHPHFSDDGRTLVFAERVPTGQKLRGLAGRLGPGGENQWAGWRIHVADFDITKSGTAMLSHSRTLQPNGDGFYETDEIHVGRIVYSHTDGGRPYVANIYEVRLDGTGMRALTDTDGAWNEHGEFSPDGKLFAFMSSRFDASWHYPGSSTRNLRTELFIEENGGKPQPITHMNDLLGKHVVVSDYDWDRTGTRIVMQVAELGSRAAPQIWLLTLK